VLLPLAAPPKVDPDSPTEEKAELRTSKRVLIVDDEPQVRKIFGLILESAGFEVVQARNGQEAIEIFERERDAIDCVLLDLSMPELDGEETFRRLQRIQHDVRVVLASGFTEQEILDRFDGSGLAGVLSKPAGRDDLIAKIQEVASPE
jgi:CheY-like chemotaxis protein